MVNKTGMTDKEFLDCTQSLEDDIKKYYEENELGDLTGLSKYLVNLGYY